MGEREIDNEELDIFEATVRDLEKNKRNKEQGIYNSIPFSLPSLDRYLPGIMGGMQYLITASSGIGKTKLTKFLFLTQPYKFVKAHPELGLSIKVLYFALEESKQEFMLDLISTRLREEFNISMSIQQLKSLGEYTLDNDTLDKIKSCKDYFKELSESIEVVDSISNPFGIYKYVRSYVNDNGKHFYKKKEINGEMVEIYDRYEQNNPKEFLIVITDHISLLLPERSEDSNTLHSAITKFSAEYGRKHMSKHWKICVVNVQQQSADKEKLQFTLGGQSIESKLEPSLDGLADNKLTQRDALVVLGLFAPERYQIDKHLGYDITILKDRYRSISILKNRYGTPNLKKGFAFDGQTSTFAELPPPDSQEMRNVYERLRNLR